MKIDCNVIRDLLPLYVDDACSENSRLLIEEHLQECPGCSDYLKKLRSTELEEGLQMEKQNVIQYGELKFKRRSTLVGTIISAIFMIPILICLMVNISTGHGLGWFFIVLASLGVAASLTVVPLMLAEDRLFWTFCGFCVTLTILLAVICLYSGGSWFWIASSATLFGLGLIFLPFVVKSRPVRKLTGSTPRWLVVLVMDGLLFANMMRSIFLWGGLRGRSNKMLIGVIAGIILIALAISQNKEDEK